MSAHPEIRAALQTFVSAADAANEAAIAFNGAILSHRKELISEATIARESATLLLHVAQNAARTTLAALGSEGESGPGGAP